MAVGCRLTGKADEAPAAFESLRVIARWTTGFDCHSMPQGGDFESTGEAIRMYSMLMGGPDFGQYQFSALPGSDDRRFPAFQTSISSDILQFLTKPAKPFHDGWTRADTIPHSLTCAFTCASSAPAPPPMGFCRRRGM